MTALRQIAVALALLGASSLCRAGDVIDRIVAVVNRQVVLESELRFVMAYQCVAAQVEVQCDLGSGARKTALDRLIDQRLLEQQMPDGQISAAMATADSASLSRQVQGRLSAQDWASRLGKYGLNEREVGMEAARQVVMLRFIDSRVRATVHIEQQDIEHYYNRVLLAQLPSGSTAPELVEVAERIREILTQQEIDRQLAGWLHTLREQAAIRMR